MLNITVCELEGRGVESGGMKPLPVAVSTFRLCDKYDINTLKLVFSLNNLLPLWIISHARFILIQGIK